MAKAKPRSRRALATRGGPGVTYQPYIQSTMLEDGEAPSMEGGRRPCASGVHESPESANRRSKTSGPNRHRERGAEEFRKLTSVRLERKEDFASERRGKEGTEAGTRTVVAGLGRLGLSGGETAIQPTSLNQGENRGEPERGAPYNQGRQWGAVLQRAPAE